MMFDRTAFTKKQKNKKKLHGKKNCMEKKKLHGEKKKKLHGKKNQKKLHGKKKRKIAWKKKIACTNLLLFFRFINLFLFFQK